MVRAEQRRRLREQKAQTMQEVLHDADPHPEWDRIRPVLDAALGDHAVEGSAGTLEFPVNERADLDAVRGRH
ncbi:MAG: hypothetical protein EXS43_05375 [Opitutus sp.]|nr:hypothetical protein [Opitutus sp.]